MLKFDILTLLASTITNDPLPLMTVKSTTEAAPTDLLVINVIVIPGKSFIEKVTSPKGDRLFSPS